MTHHSVARSGGALFAAVFGLTARLRGTRALHPVGVCGTGALATVPGPPSGVPLLDEPGPHRCLVRWSRATGRQDGLDVEGLAVRIEGPGEGDLLLASTGTGVLGRHLLVLRRPRHHGPLTTLLPPQCERGPLLVGLDPVGAEPADPPTAYRVLVGAPGRSWHERGELTLSWTDHDCVRRHDPVGHPPVGTWTHPFWAHLRDPAYGASQQVLADPEEARAATDRPG